jgi:hypothetical protein
VRHAGRTIRRRQRSGPVVFKPTVFKPINKHAQHAVLTRPAHFHFDYFQPARACHPLGNLPDPIQI